LNRKILLINPWVEDFTCFDFWMKPVGLLRFQAYFRRLGFQTRLIDCLAFGTRPRRSGFSTGKYLSEEIEKPDPISHVPRRYQRFGISLERFLTELSRIPDPDFVFVTCCMTYWYGGAARVIHRVKEMYPNAVILLGGVYPTLCPDHAERVTGADRVIPSNGNEPVIDRVCRVLGIPKPEISLADVFPDYSDYPRIDSLALVTSIGCPYRCTYCAAYVIHPEFIQRSAEECIRELAHYRDRYPVVDLAFYDDALLLRPGRHIEKILDWIIEQGPGWRLHLPNAIHAKFVSPDLARKMKAAGFETIRLGFESADVNFQRGTGDKTDSGDLVRAVEYLNGAGFAGGQIGAYVMYGNPGLNVESVFETVEFVRSLGIQTKLATYSPVPGTADFERYAKEVPEIRNEPLLHNDVICRYRNPEEYETLVNLVRSANRKVEVV
jgi:radical SAM superfamily enzyme YgiQ (UPF0313 family)